MKKESMDRKAINQESVNEPVITVIGSLNYDIIFKQKRLARLGETYTAESVDFVGGGKGANQAV
jgi:ribokinase